MQAQQTLKQAVLLRLRRMLRDDASSSDGFARICAALACGFAVVPGDRKSVV